MKHTKSQFFNINKGFTLPEVLITLFLLGIVMSITIPSMLTRVASSSQVPGLRKIYGMLDSAVTKIMLTNSGSLVNAFTSSTDARDKFGLFFEYNRVCSTGSVAGNCWAIYSSKLSGGDAVESFNPNVDYTAAIMADGSTLLFYIPNVACDGTGVSIALPYASSAKTFLCGYIVVDTNGFKVPNTFGRDMFMFLLGSNGLYPGGDAHTLYNDQSVECRVSQTAKNGYGCASKVLNEGAINY